MRFRIGFYRFVLRWRCWLQRCGPTRLILESHPAPSLSPLFPACVSSSARRAFLEVPSNRLSSCGRNPCGTPPLAPHRSSDRPRSRNESTALRPAFRPEWAAGSPQPDKPVPRTKSSDLQDHIYCPLSSKTSPNKTGPSEFTFEIRSWIFASSSDFEYRCTVFDVRLQY